jgi:hypothetical protein
MKFSTPFSWEPEKYDSREVTYLSTPLSRETVTIAAALDPALVPFNTHFVGNIGHFPVGVISNNFQHPFRGKLQ